MTRTILILLMMVTSPTLSLCLQSETQEPAAIVNILSGSASFRQKKGMKATRLTREKDLAKELLPNQQIRCLGDCQIELLLCTGSKVYLTREDGWYRLPVLTCERDKFIPGFKNYLLPGGRQSNLLQDSDPTNRTLAYRADRGSVGRQQAGSMDLGSVGRQQTATFGAGFWGYYRRSLIRGHYDISFFRYPYEGALVVPQLFFFDIEGDWLINREPQRKVQMIVSLSAFDEKNPLKVSKEWAKELYIQREGLVTAEGTPLDLKEVRSFFDEIRKGYGENSARIYCKITVGAVPGHSAGNLKPHTFGVEFYLMNNADEKAVMGQLEISNEATGIAHFLGRAQIFEALGITRLAIIEYFKALELSPNNELIQSRLRSLRGF